jgi:glycosyltransferase involved in cell wall biosynthesis
MIRGWGTEPSRIAVVHSSTPDVSGTTTAIDRDAARKRLCWSADGRYLLTAARLTAWKGVDHLIDAVVRVPAVTLIVAGDGPEREALTARAASRRAPVRFAGNLSRDALAVHIKAADYVVLYSGYEGLSHVLLEALDAGTPVIASHRGGNPEIVRDDCNGILVKHPDPDALAGALRRAFENGTRKRLASRARHGIERFRASTAIPIVANEIEAAANQVQSPDAQCAS